MKLEGLEDFSIGERPAGFDASALCEQCIGICRSTSAMAQCCDHTCLSCFHLFFAVLFDLDDSSILTGPNATLVNKCKFTNERLRSLPIEKGIVMGKHFKTRALWSLYTELAKFDHHVNAESCFRHSFLVKAMLKYVPRRDLLSVFDDDTEPIENIMATCPSWPAQ